MKRRGSLIFLALACGLAASASLDYEKGDTTSVFPDGSGIPKLGEPAEYAPENLYKYIDGAAEVYLGYGFEELAVQIYESEKGPSLTAEIYEHSDPRNGFGIYASERPVEGDFLKIGAQGYYEEGILNFVRGSYYVKLSSYALGDQDRSVLAQVAADIAARLGGDRSLPEILGRFPDRGKVENSERFIPQDFLGYAFLRNAYTCDYRVSESKFRLFAIEGRDSAECEAALKEYLRLVEYPEVAAEGRAYTVEDPHHGTVGLLWEGGYVWGILGLESEALRTEYLTGMRNPPPGDD